LQCFPNPLLKSGATDVQRKVEADSGLLYQSNYFCDQVLVASLVPNQIRFREPVLKIPYQSLRVFANQDRTNAFVALGDQD